MHSTQLWYGKYFYVIFLNHGIHSSNNAKTQWRFIHIERNNVCIIMMLQRDSILEPRSNAMFLSHPSIQSRASLLSWISCLATWIEKVHAHENSSFIWQWNLKLQESFWNYLELEQLHWPPLPQGWHCLIRGVGNVPTIRSRTWLNHRSFKLDAFPCTPVCSVCHPRAPSTTLRPLLIR